MEYDWMGSLVNEWKAKAEGEIEKRTEELQGEIEEKDIELQQAIEDIRSMKENIERGSRFVEIGEAKFYENNFIGKYAFVDDGLQGTIKILLKYDDDMNAVIQGIQRVSRPGRRRYFSAKQMPRVLNGLGIAIVTTSNGLLTDRDCRKMNVGGEIIGNVW